MNIIIGITIIAIGMFMFALLTIAAIAQIQMQWWYCPICKLWYNEIGETTSRRPVGIDAPKFSWCKECKNLYGIKN